jgi:hypothetical protein
MEVKMKFFNNNDYETMNEEGQALSKEIYALLKPVFERPEYKGNIRVLSMLICDEVRYLEAIQVLTNSMELRKANRPETGQ